MGATEKENLINTLTIRFVEEFNVSLKDCKVLVSDILQNYHVQASKEKCNGTDFSTPYLMQKFINGKKSSGMSDSTLNQYLIAVNCLEKHTGKQLADIEVEDIQDFLTKYRERVSSVTVRAKYQLLSSVYNYLYLHNYLNYNPISCVTPPKADVIYKKPVSDYEIEKIKRDVTYSDTTWLNSDYTMKGGGFDVNVNIGMISEPKVQGTICDKKVDLKIFTELFNILKK